MRTLLIAFLMTLATQAGADEIIGRMSCKVKSNEVIEIEEGKPTKYSNVENEFKVGDTLTLIYDHYLDVFGLKLYDGLREKDVYSLALGFNEFGINASAEIRATDYGAGIQNNELGARIEFSNESISSEYFNSNSEYLTLNLSRYYKDDWQGMLFRKAKFWTQVVTLDCRTLINQIALMPTALLQLHANAMTAANGGSNRTTGDDDSYLETNNIEQLLSELRKLEQTSSYTRRSLEADLAAALAAKLEAETDRKKVQDQLQQALAAKLAADHLSKTRLNESVERQILLQNTKEQLAEKTTALDKRTKDLLKAEKQSALLNQQVSELRKQLGQLQALLEASEELYASNQVQLQNLGNRLNAALARAASEQRKRLKLEQAARKKLEEERNSLASQAEELAKYKSEFFGRLHEVLAAEEGVRVVGDRFVFSSEVLFQPAQARLSGKGEDEITKVGRILQRVMADIPDGIDWVIRVDGHTDNLPLSGTGRYKDNWELSQARALSVVKFMITQLQLPASRLAANGFGEFQPVNLANTAQARAQNRRIEIKLTER